LDKEILDKKKIKKDSDFEFIKNQNALATVEEEQDNNLTELQQEKEIKFIITIL